MMRQKIIGVFPIGFEDVELVLRDGNGGEFFNCPEPGKCPRIKIGADVKEWKDIVAVLVHEAMEFRMNRCRARFDPSYDVGKDHGSYLFVMDHQIFSDCCAQVGELLVCSLPALAVAWKKWKK